jgi:adenylate kinase
LTGKLLNVYLSPQAELDECKSAGGELIQREDDNEETIANRLEVYRQQTEPLVEFYRQRGCLKTVDADGSVDAVFERLLEALT